LCEKQVGRFGSQIPAIITPACICSRPFRTVPWLLEARPGLATQAWNYLLQEDRRTVHPDSSPNTTTTTTHNSPPRTTTFDHLHRRRFFAQRKSLPYLPTSFLNRSRVISSASSANFARYQQSTLSIIPSLSHSRIATTSIALHDKISRQSICHSSTRSIVAFSFFVASSKQIATFLSQVE
jgi:hypothetical protein